MIGMRPPPLVSVIIPAFNAQNYIKETIESALEQDWKSLEVVVVDDGSNDDTVAIAQGFDPHVRVLRGAHEGLSAARNRGIAAATGGYLLHLDADDLLLPGAISTMMGTFARNPTCEIVAGRLLCFISPDLSRDAALCFRIPSGPQRGHLPGVAITKAEVFGRLGGLNPNYEPASDMEWWLRARTQHVHIQLVDDLVLKRRIHGANNSLRNSKQLNDISLKIVRQNLTQKRTGTGHATRR